MDIRETPYPPFSPYYKFAGCKRAIFPIRLPDILFFRFLQIF